ncbi:flagellar biosynthesis protein FlhB [Dongia deserti]|uniref:flagellar biosynthesis protein FlhB n=1 Tax=Dongia deserti TaxID=2268030 RepID=UPI000E658C79|nr:flagellar biosynthesis protein FlhB [Dongia deserti]
MAEEQDDSQKTEDPTSRRLDEARKRGQVANSREINNLLMLTVFSLSVLLFGGTAAGAIYKSTMPFIESPDLIPTDFGHLVEIGWQLLGALLIAGIIPLVLALAAAVGAGYLQFGLIFSAESITPKFSKISPLGGLKRMFSMRSLAEFVRGLLKIAVVASVALFLIVPEVVHFHKLIGMEMIQLLSEVRGLLARLMIGVVAIVAAIATLDVIYQRMQHLREMRMSRQEIKDEFKETEGDPLVKGRLRQLRMERTRRRMMAQVPQSDVVVTNPTHYAVALKYDPGTMSAPKMMAKGVDKIAEKIREIAKEHGIPVIENPPLARGLYAAVEVDQEVTPEFYKAVAELISYIFRLKGRRL